MARIRSVKPEFFTSLDTADLSIPARFLFIGLWTYADDEGRGIADPRLVKADLHPLDDQVSSQDIAALLDELEANRRIERYEVDGRPLFQVVNWHHQKIDRRTPSKYPAPRRSLGDTATNGQRDRDEDSPPDRIGSLDRIPGSSIQSQPESGAEPGYPQTTDRSELVVLAIAKAQAAEKPAVRNREAYTAKCARNARTEHGEKIADLVERYPTAPADVIAGHILGQPSSLGRYVP